MRQVSCRVFFKLQNLQPVQCRFVSLVVLQSPFSSRDLLSTVKHQHGGLSINLHRGAPIKRARVALVHVLIESSKSGTTLISRTADMIRDECINYELIVVAMSN